MARITTIFLLAIFSASASADWVPIGRNYSFDLYADPSSIELESVLWGRQFVKIGHDIVDLRSMKNFKTIQNLGEQAFLSVESSVGYDCKDKESRTYHHYFYAGPMGTGTRVVALSWSTSGKYSGPRAKWEPVCERC